jgi:hypothetical protein
LVIWNHCGLLCWTLVERYASKRYSKAVAESVSGRSRLIWRGPGHYSDSSAALTVYCLARVQVFLCFAGEPTPHGHDVNFGNATPHQCLQRDHGLHTHHTRSSIVSRRHFDLHLSHITCRYSVILLGLFFAACVS